MRSRSRAVTPRSVAIVAHPRAIDLTARAVPSSARDVDRWSNAVSYL